MSGFSFATAIISVLVFIAALGCFEIGRRFGVRSLRHDPEGGGEGLGAIEAALLGLLGLLLAFTFSGAAGRFDTRRELIVEEANAIDTAYMRVDLLPPDAHAVLREKFREYLDARIDVYRRLADREDTAPAEEQSRQIQREIWSIAVSASERSPTTTAGMQIVPALNEMINIETSRTMTRQMHPPQIIFFMLGALILVSATISGFGTAKAKKRSWLHLILFAFVFALTLFVILDI